MYKAQLHRSGGHRGGRGDLRGIPQDCGLRPFICY